jgi:hypothetical protein
LQSNWAVPHQEQTNPLGLSINSNGLKRGVETSGEADLRAEPTHQEQSEPVGNRSIQAVWSEAT